MMGRNAEVPAPAANIVTDAEIPSMNDGLLKAWYPSSKSPVCGAAAGRSLSVTPITTIKTAVNTHAKPTHVSQLKFPNLRILDMIIMQNMAIREK